MSFLNDLYVAIYDSGCQICCTGVDSSQVLRNQHTEVPCLRLTLYPTKSHYNDISLTSPALALRCCTLLSREAIDVIFSVFDLTRPGIEPPTFRILNERSITTHRGVL